MNTCAIFEKQSYKIGKNIAIGSGCIKVILTVMIKSKTIGVELSDIQVAKVSL